MLIGRVLERLKNYDKLLIGILGLIANTVGVNATVVIGLKSLKILYGSFIVLGFTAIGFELPKVSVYPLGVDLTVKSVPIVPFAPGLFSTIIDTPKTSPSLGAIIRVTMSFDPPGGKPTIIVMFWIGNFS